jgi:hypothetical protein
MNSTFPDHSCPLALGWCSVEVLIRPDRHTRIGLFFLSLAFAGIAFYLYQGKEGYTSGYTIRGDYFSQLIDDEVSIGRLRAVALSDEFRSIVGGLVEVSDVPESPYHLRVATTMASQDKLHEAHNRAVSLLSTKLKELAMLEVSSALEYLDRVEKSRVELSGQLKDSVEKSQSTMTRRLTETDSARAILLQEKIQQLESFLAGGPLAKSLRIQLDRETLRNTEIRVEKAERELARLARVFQPASKAVQAQRELTERAQADLLSLERELATLYLRTLKIELEALDDKAASIVEQNTAEWESDDAPAVSEGQGDTKGTEWLSARAEEIQQRADEISRVSALKLAGDLVVERRTDSSRPFVVTCWTASLGLFLAALFLGPSSSGTAEEDVRPTRREPPPSVVRLEIADSFLRRSPDPAPDKAEAFFRLVTDEITEALGRVPRRILVVGDSNVESRLSFSIRLANLLGKNSGRVRLLDFDFDSKSLSQRLGREALPGVRDLLSHGGPVDEFFSSIAGTRIQFAAAGSTILDLRGVDSDRVEMILGRGKDELAIVDASCSSPVHILLPQVDAVLCVLSGTSEGGRTVAERSVLQMVRGAGVPVWGVSPDSSQVFPLL